MTEVSLFHNWISTAGSMLLHGGEGWAGTAPEPCATLPSCEPAWGSTYSCTELHWPKDVVLPEGNPEG